MIKFLKILLVLLVFPFVFSAEAKANPEENLFIQFVPNNQVKLVGKFDEGPDCLFNHYYDIGRNPSDKHLLNNCRKTIDDSDSTDTNITTSYFIQVLQDVKNSKCVLAKLILKKANSLNKYG